MILEFLIGFLGGFFGWCSGLFIGHHYNHPLIGGFIGWLGGLGIAIAIVATIC